MVGRRFADWIDRCQLVVVVGEIPIDEKVFVGQLCSFRQFLHDVQHFGCRMQIFYFSLIQQLGSFHSSEIARIVDEITNCFQEVVVQSFAFVSQPQKQLREHAFLSLIDLIQKRCKLLGVLD